MVLAGPLLHRRAGDLAFNAIAVAHGLLVILAVQIAPKVEGRRALWIILGIGLVLRLALLFDLPSLSTDAFRYVWDGRVQGEGINPYRYLPAAPELAYLRDAVIYPWINRADYAITIYPPAAQMLFFLVGRIADGMVAMKLAFIGFEAVTVLVLLDLLRRIGQSTTRIVAYVWHPLALWEIAGNAHIDAAMLALMMLGVWIVAVLRRPVAAAAVLAIAAMMKPLAALALPFAWKPWDWRAPLVAVVTVALLYVPYLSVGTGMFSFVPGYIQEENIGSGDAFWVVWIVNSLFGPQAWAKPVYLLAAAALLATLALRLSFATEETTEQRLRRLSWLVFAGLIALSPGYPWYYLCILPFVVLFGSPPFWAATIGCYLLYDQYPDDPQVAFWVRDGLMHLAIVAGLLAVWWRSSRPPAAIARSPA